MFCGIILSGRILPLTESHYRRTIRRIVSLMLFLAPLVLATPAGPVVRPLLGESATLWHTPGWRTVRVTCADMAWGCLLCAASSAVMRLVDGWLPR